MKEIHPEWPDFTFVSCHCSRRSWASLTWLTSGGDGRTNPRTTSVPSSRPRLSRANPRQMASRCGRTPASEAWAPSWTESPTEPGTRWDWTTAELNRLRDGCDDNMTDAASCCFLISQSAVTATTLLPLLAAHNTSARPPFLLAHQPDPVPYEWRDSPTRWIHTWSILS